MALPQPAAAANASPDPSAAAESASSTSIRHLNETETSPEIQLTAGARLLRVTEATAQALGARLCFDAPVSHGARTVIPVAGVFTAGGLGFGTSSRQGDPQEGGGGGGVLSARPVGFIELTGEDARFRPIITASDVVQVLALASASLLARRGWRRRRR